MWYKKSHWNKHWKEANTYSSLLYSRNSTDMCSLLCSSILSNKWGHDLMLRNIDFGKLPTSHFKALQSLISSIQNWYVGACRTPFGRATKLSKLSITNFARLWKAFHGISSSSSLHKQSRSSLCLDIVKPHKLVRCARQMLHCKTIWHGLKTVVVRNP